jgi:hypothetical protein
MRSRGALAALCLLAASVSPLGHPAAATASQQPCRAEASAVQAWLGEVGATLVELDLGITGYILGLWPQRRWDAPEVREALATELATLVATAPPAPPCPTAAADPQQGLDALRALQSAVQRNDLVALWSALDGAHALLGTANDESRLLARWLGWHDGAQELSADTFLWGYWAAVLQRAQPRSEPIAATATWRQLRSATQQALAQRGLTSMAPLGAVRPQELPALAAAVPPSDLELLRNDLYRQDLGTLACFDVAQLARSFARSLAPGGAGGGGSAAAGGDLTDPRSELVQAMLGRLAAWPPLAGALEDQRVALLTALDSLRLATIAAQEARQAAQASQASGSQGADGTVAARSTPDTLVRQTAYNSLARSLTRAAIERLEGLQGQLPPCSQPDSASTPTR